MQHHRTLLSAALLALLLTSFVIAPAAFAGDVIFSGALNPASASFQRPTGPGGPWTGVHACTTLQSDLNYSYQAFPFSVSADGSYTMTITASAMSGSGSDATDTFMILYQGLLDPANPLSGCRAINDDIAMNTNFRSEIPNYALTANTQYTLVITTFSPRRSGTFSGRISGPGDVMLGLYQPPVQNGAPAAPEVFRGFEPGDGRLNLQAYAPAAVYCDAANSRVAIYGIDDAGHGYEAIFVPYADLPDIPVSNQLIAQFEDIRFFRLSTGEYQVSAGPDAEGKEYMLIFDGCPASTAAAYLFDHLTGALTQTESR